MQEIFAVSGVAPDVTYARAAAWQGLLQILGTDPPESWALHRAMYNIGEIEAEEPDEAPRVVCRYQIEIVRIPEEAAP